MAASASPPGDQAVPGGFRLGTIQGIEIRVQWSLLVVFALIATSIAVGLIPQRVDEPIVGFSWVLGVVGAITFLEIGRAHV